MVWRQIIDLISCGIGEAGRIHQCGGRAITLCTGCWAARYPQGLLILMYLFNFSHCMIWMANLHVPKPTWVDVYQVLAIVSQFNRVGLITLLPLRKQFRLAISFTCFPANFLLFSGLELPSRKISKFLDLFYLFFYAGAQNPSREQEKKNKKFNWGQFCYVKH